MSQQTRSFFFTYRVGVGVIALMKTVNCILLQLIMSRPKMVDYLELKPLFSHGIFHRTVLFILTIYQRDNVV